ncbi:Cysteine-rich secretory protein family protein [Ulvibacter antarcticus]|uniref:Cysteine-rich secretory protein family protein n=2 Tax=Ulvibacter antarcticus TaxID=442714 RepID=A0A3L9Z292_9FLAO|nr:Cysteine-rich secretory protein family protein [Ulvibacter antarcticus]
MVFLFLATSCQKDESFTSEEANYTIDLNLANETDWKMADEILVLVNEYRNTLGLTPIISDKQFASAYAVDHSHYMMAKSQINHDNFGVRAQALRDNGAERVGENVAFGYNTAEAVVQAWLNSEGHREIIEGNFSHSGFGVLKASDNRYYFTQLFYKK